VHTSKAKRYVCCSFGCLVFLGLGLGRKPRLCTARGRIWCWDYETDMAALEGVHIVLLPWVGVISCGPAGRHVSCARVQS